MTRAAVWSFGGGTQSVAIAVLVVEGRLPKPERIVMADTGRENAATWLYLDAHVRPLLAGVGLAVEIVPMPQPPPLYSPGGDVLIPAFTLTGKLNGFCSGEWKRDRIMRWMRAQGFGPKRPVLNWIGYSLDEIGRVSADRKRWVKAHWPLLWDVPMRRDECSRLVVRAGLPAPPKSSCFMCPHQQNRQWRQVRDDSPADWQQAIAIDREIRARDKRGGVFLHHSATPLECVDLDTPERPDSPLFGPSGECAQGGCFT